MARIFLGRGRKKSGDDTQNAHRQTIPEIVTPVLRDSDILLEIFYRCCSDFLSFPLT